MDIPSKINQFKVMGQIRHLFLAILLAVFAVGTVAHATMTTEMTLAISVGGTGMDMPDCSGSKKDAKTDMTACDVACTAPLAADLQGVASTGPRVFPQHEPSVVQGLRGRTGPPALDPPRSLI